MGVTRALATARLTASAIHAFEPSRASRRRRFSSTALQLGLSVYGSIVHRFADKLPQQAEKENADPLRGPMKAVPRLLDELLIRQPHDWSFHELPRPAPGGQSEPMPHRK